jgi:hypothetical protein
MASIKLHAGDWGKGSGSYMFGQISLPKPNGWGALETIAAATLTEVELASEDSVKRLGGTVGWGVVGAVALGPVGLLAGLLLGGKGKDVTFVAKFKDGRKILATTDSKTYTKLKAAVF